MAKPKLTVGLPSTGQFLPPGDLRRTLDFARAADAAGIDGLKLVDHVVLGPDLSSYAWGPYMHPPHAPFPEPMVMAAALAAVTERIKLDTAIVIAPMRPAVVLAKQAATLDAMSDGRLRLGVGTGWQPEALESAGVPFAERGARLTETVEACRVLWRDSPASYSGTYVKFEDMYCEPRPSRGYVPVFFAGALSSRTLERIVRIGEGWLPIMGSTPESLAEDVPRLRAALADAGRDPAEAEISFNIPPVPGSDGRPSLDHTLESAVAFGESGVTIATLTTTSFTTPDEMLDWIGVAARRWEAF